MPALLPPANVDVKVDESCSICGWGNMAYPDFRPAEKLQCVDLPVIGTNTCNKGYRGAIHEDIMCIGLMKGGQDSCQVNDQSKIRKNREFRETTRTMEKRITRYFYRIKFNSTFGFSPTHNELFLSSRATLAVQQFVMDVSMVL